jgi:pilus assembly protein CpaE
MTVVSVLSAKGGSGASLIATNLAVVLAGRQSTLLVDLHAGLGYDDLLLDLNGERSWADLLPVADELSPQHLTLATGSHPSGLKVLCAPTDSTTQTDDAHLRALLHRLAEDFAWLILDPPAWPGRVSWIAVEMSDALLLITTADPGSLRAARRLYQSMPKETQSKTGLVVNQIGGRHPADPSSVADSIGVTLLAALPPDPRGVGYQVNFGQVCALDNRSAFGRAVVQMTGRIVQAAAVRLSVSSTQSAVEAAR